MEGQVGASLKVILLMFFSFKIFSETLGRKNILHEEWHIEKVNENTHTEQQQQQKKKTGKDKK